MYWNSGKQHTSFTCTFVYNGQPEGGKKPSAFITARHIKDSVNFVTDKNVAKCSHYTLETTLASFQVT